MGEVNWYLLTIGIFSFVESLRNSRMSRVRAVRAEWDKGQAEGKQDQMLGRCGLTSSSLRGYCFPRAYQSPRSPNWAHPEEQIAEAIWELREQSKQWQCITHCWQGEWVRVLVEMETAKSNGCRSKKVRVKKTEGIRPSPQYNEGALNFLCCAPV